MLAYANNFWPLLWTLFGAGALLSVLLSAALGLTWRLRAVQAATTTTASFAADRDREVRAAA